MSQAGRDRLVRAYLAGFGADALSEALQAQAVATITELEAKLDQMRGTDALQGFNKSYARHRAACAAAGKPAMRYTGWFWIFKLAAARQIGEEHRRQLDQYLVSPLTNDAIGRSLRAPARGQNYARQTRKWGSILAIRKTP